MFRQWKLKVLIPALTFTAVVSDKFLDFTASRGNDLRMAGLTGGCKWCLCASRWKEALDARNGDNDDMVPKYVIYH